MTAQDDNRKRVNAIRRKNREDMQDIGELPPVTDWGRRNGCENDLVRFLTTYLPQAFPRKFSAKHLDAVQRIQDCLVQGDMALLPLPRGFGKSTICVGAAIWGALYGHRKFLPIITAGDAAAEARMMTVKAILEMSPLLAEDFPEVCHPVRMVDGITQRARGLRYDGEVLHMLWGKMKVVLPSIPGMAPDDPQARAGGAVIQACGIMSRRIRGLQHMMTDGSIVRPDFVLVDDPQDDESAKNPAQVKKLLDTFNASIMGLAGHDKAMSVAIACNVLAKDDMIERLLDPENPNGFQGERVPLIIQFPAALDTHWEEYRRLLTSYDKAVVGDVARARDEAKAYYLDNREAMDAGAVVTWEDNFDDRSVSAIQYAMYKFYTTPPDAFAAEYQNQPLEDETENAQLTVDELKGKVLKGYKQGDVPTGMERLTAFVDIQQTCLFWLVAAWGPGFTGHVVDYGVFPKQTKRYFTLRQVTKTLEKMFPGCGREAFWRAGLDALTEELLGREFHRVDGTIMRIEQLFPDANDGYAQPVVEEFCRNSKHPTVVMPYKSRGLKAGDRPLSEQTKKKGDTHGLNWRIGKLSNAPRGIPFIFADVNWWKSFVRERLRTAVGDPGAMTFFAGDAERHRLLFDHLTSEYFVRTEGRGRALDEWHERPNTKENHWWDCLVGAAVAASVRGTALSEIGVIGAKKQIRMASREELAAMGWG